MRMPRAADGGHCVGLVRIAASDVQSSNDGILALLENLRSGKRRGVAICVKSAGEADAFRMIAAMPECWASRRRQRGDELGGRDAMRRKPACRVGECDGRDAGNGGDE